MFYEYSFRPVSDRVTVNDDSLKQYIEEKLLPHFLPLVSMSDSGSVRAVKNLPFGVLEIKLILNHKANYKVVAPVTEG